MVLLGGCSHRSLSWRVKHWRSDTLVRTLQQTHSHRVRTFCKQEFERGYPQKPSSLRPRSRQRPSGPYQLSLALWAQISTEEINGLSPHLAYPLPNRGARSQPLEGPLVRSHSEPPGQSLRRYCRRVDSIQLMLFEYAKVSRGGVEIQIYGQALLTYNIYISHCATVLDSMMIMNDEALEGWREDSKIECGSNPFLRRRSGFPLRSTL